MSLITSSRETPERLDNFHHLTLFSRQVRGQQEFYDPDHTVHRSAYLMAHGGEELALGLIRLLGA